MDVTRGVFTLLDFNKEAVDFIKGNLTISMLFPELKDADILTLLKSQQGAVLLFSREYCEIEEYHEEEDNGESSVDSCGDKKRILVWTRIVEEKYGNDEIQILLVSPIERSHRKNYARNTTIYINCSY